MYNIEINGQKLKSLFEYDLSGEKPLTFPTKDAAESYAKMNNYTNYKIVKAK